MGYDYDQEETQFHLAHEQYAAALAALQQVRPVASLAEALDPWELDLNLSGDIIGLALRGNRHLVPSCEMFAELAPFVEPGSFIRMRGEEGEEFRWTFDGGVFQEIEEQAGGFR
jgi:hypothetical protein